MKSGAKLQKIFYINKLNLKKIMKAIIIKKFDNVLKKKEVEIYIVENERMKDILEWKNQTLKRELTEGFIGKYEIEIHDKVKVTTMI